MKVCQWVGTKAECGKATMTDTRKAGESVLELRRALRRAIRKSDAASYGDRAALISYAVFGISMKDTALKKQKFVSRSLNCGMSCTIQSNQALDYAPQWLHWCNLLPPQRQA
jgi:hypothetical protein